MEDKCKKNGEIAELLFSVEIKKRNMIICSPQGDSDQYDFIVDCNSGLKRVQVKSIWVKCNKKDRYMTKAGHWATKRAYTKVDVFAVYINDLNAWYLIPSNKVDGVNLCFYPHRSSNGKNECFLENWGVFG